MPPRTRKSAAADKAANDTSSTHQPTPDDARNDKEVKRGNWGRVQVPFITILLMVLLMTSVPFIVVAFWAALEYFHGSFQLAIMDALHAPSLWTWILNHLPQPSWEATVMYLSWTLFQALIYAFYPVPTSYGNQTPGGNVLGYKCNGWHAWWISHILFLGLSTPGLNLFPTSIIADHWGGLLVITNIYGYLFPVFLYIKALYFPSYPSDCRFTGSRVYDFVHGVEINPRIGEWFDLKLFHNGRPGIVAWTMINISFAAYEYNLKGYVSKEMIGLNILHAFYVVDFFYWESWYLRTLDITLERLGVMLLWGDAVWLPFMYTLQSQYIARNDVNLPMPVYAFLWTLGLVGYYIFRNANNQKDIVRAADGKCDIWGKPAKVIRATYTTADGVEHQSLLLASGYWGLSRHFNYFGDLMMCTAFCGMCGVNDVLPWFYLVFMTILLSHRCKRDDDRCGGKYGKYWQEYKQQVPWNMIPYIW